MRQLSLTDLKPGNVREDTKTLMKTIDTDTLKAARIGYIRQIQETEKKILEINQELARRGGETDRPTPVDKRTGRAVAVKTGTKKHRISAEGRARIAEAQKKRWAKAKRAAKTPTGKSAKSVKKATKKNVVKSKTNGKTATAEVKEA